MSSQRSAYQLTLTALISMASLSACDSLWFPFTKDESTSCVNKTPQCDNSSQTCNVDTGMCEPGSGTPLTFTDVSPKWLPMAGGPIAVRGWGFRYDNVSSKVSVDGLATTPIAIAADLITATAQPARQLCVPVALDINRDDGKSLSIPNALVYRFEPYSINQFSKINGFIDGIDQLYVGQLNKSNQKADILVKKLNGGFSVIPNESMAVVSSPEIKFAKVAPAYFSKLSNYAYVTALVDDSFNIYQYNETSISLLASNPTSKKFYKDMLALDINQFNTAGDELALLNSDPTNGSFLSLYTVNIQATGGAQVTAGGVLSLLYDSYAMAPFPTKSSGPVDRFIISQANLKVASQSNIGFFLIVSVADISNLNRDSYIMNSTLPNELTAIATKDLDMDDKPDISSYSSSTGNAYVLLSTENYSTVKVLQGFSRSLRKPSNVNLQVVDANCDGRPDLFLADLSGTESSIIHYNNPGGFSPDPANLVQLNIGAQDKIQRVQALMPTSAGIIPNLLFMKTDGIYVGYPSFQKQ